MPKYTILLYEICALIDGMLLSNLLEKQVLNMIKRIFGRKPPNWTNPSKWQIFIFFLFHLFRGKREKRKIRQIVANIPTRRLSGPRRTPRWKMPRQSRSTAFSHCSGLPTLLIFGDNVWPQLNAIHRVVVVFRHNTTGILFRWLCLRFGAYMIHVPKFHTGIFSWSFSMLRKERKMEQEKLKLTFPNSNVYIFQVEKYR